ncbi:AAA family ATPase [Sulfitobacter sp. S223]|uniref:AAA family ATPase n=1 Tax=Sulfitobacter sp. S223 TaxID=2867023 RepID=UPI0021A92010|nr:AAA family ATPase [Sulfitobacter sp. S223]UWR27375.1 AAA family ATPase [Sulfitobacter sp. S223]
MKISSFCLKNYRRLIDVELVLDDQKTILVGANNSGKTSGIGALYTFLMRPENLRVRDISKQHWQLISSIGVQLGADEISTGRLETLRMQLVSLLPRLDVTICAEAREAYRARDILPHLDWRGGPLGVRIAYEPVEIAKLAADYSKAREVVAKHDGVSLWPKNLFDFLEKGSNFSKYIKQKHYILGLDTETAIDLDEDGEQAGKSEPRLQPLNSGALRKLIRVDVISEQRGLGTEDSANEKGPYSEKQRLHKLLREYYDRFLNPDDFPEAGDIEVLQKQQEMEEGFTKRLEQQFKAPLEELVDMGYPGIGGNPTVEIAAKISGTDALQKSSSVRYRFDKNQDENLPESYLGLGYQNLIYLTFRLLGFRDKWMRKGKSVSSDEDLTEEIEPIHLVLVEEPEVNLHAQVQRVFIAQAYETLRKHPALGQDSTFQTQLVVSTHSSHVVNDVNFKDLRYFRRSSANGAVNMDHTSIENMSELFSTDEDAMKFVSKHLKLTHCDIFFADGVIFVEGQAERLLVPEFIANRFRGLSKRYLSILEVSGAHTHKYKALVEKLGVVTLVITDLDSRDAAKQKCAPQKGVTQTTSNYTLTSWYPRKRLIDALVALPPEPSSSKSSTVPLFVAYQKPIVLGENEVLSRTFEDALILENFVHPHFDGIAKLQAAKKSFEDGSVLLEEALFRYVQTLTKGDFAFDCLFYIASEADNFFEPPAYIREGLEWLQAQLFPRL